MNLALENELIFSEVHQEPKAELKAYIQYQTSFEEIYSGMLVDWMKSELDIDYSY